MCLCITAPVSMAQEHCGSGGEYQEVRCETVFPRNGCTEKTGRENFSRGPTPRQNYRQLMIAGRRVSFSQARAFFLVVQYTVVSPESIYTLTTKMHSACCIYIVLHTFTYMCVTIIIKKKRLSVRLKVCAIKYGLS